MKKFLILLFAAIISLEISGYVLSFAGLEPTGYRLYLNGEWLDPHNAYADRDTVVGVWHLPNDRWIQNGPCFTTEMRSNKFGARDNDWDVKKKGYLFLGSSFIEGYGVSYQHRISEYFEQLSGKEVFNCAMSGTFTPVQYYMAMHKFKSTLDFDTCFVFLILPTDDKLVFKADPKRYRPYLKNDSIIYTRSKKFFPELKDVKEKVQLLTLQYSYTYHLFEYSKNRNMLKSRLLQTTKDDNYTKEETKYPGLSTIMEKFCLDFPDKYFYFVLIPTLNSNDGKLNPPPYKNAEVIDLRSSLDNATDYFDCNTHWNERGHEKVAKALKKAITTE